MAKLTCPCGNVLSTVSCPNDLQYFALAIDNGCSITRDYEDRDQMVEIWKCTCGNIAWFGEGAKRCVWYAPVIGVPKLTP